MNKLKLDSFLEYNFIANLEISPDSSFSAFTITGSNVEENKYDSNIYVLNNSTNEYKRLTFSNEEKNSIWLNKDTILFTSKRNKKLESKKSEGEKWTVYSALNINGGEAYEYMSIPLSVEAIKKIDENNFILIVNYDNYGTNLNDLSGKDREAEIKKINDEKDYEVLDEIPFWFNGKGFINKKRSRLCLYNRIDNKITYISNPLMNVEAFEYKEGKILFFGETHTDKMSKTHGLYLYNIKKDKLKTLINDKEYNISYANFFKDKIICALKDMKTYGINENPALYILDDEKLELLINEDVSFRNSVGSDCRYGTGYSIKVIDDNLYYIKTLDNYSVLNKLNINGNNTVLTELNGSIDFFDVSGEKLYYVAMKDYKLQEIYTLENGKEKIISSFNTEIFNKYKISMPESFTFESSGDTLEGFVIKPINFDPEKKYPAILDIHGGPKGVFGNVFYHEMQVWANKGYFVFFTNPHGSDGRGNKFADIRGKYGTIDFDDLMNFTNIVIDKYENIDKDKVGVTGGSYGGYMTNWIIGHTNIFKCAVSQRSISNWISKFGTTDIGYYFNADQNLSTPWKDHDKLWWHSPLKYADQVKTPTLFIHSEEDYRCWLPEGIQMFTALKYHGIESRLCMFKGENHELSRSGKPKHRIKRLEEMTNWFEKYLK